jgi:hypothetical protein
MTRHNKKKPPVITLAHSEAWRMLRSSSILSRADGGNDDGEYWSVNFNFPSSPRLVMQAQPKHQLPLRHK